MRARYLTRLIVPIILATALPALGVNIPTTLRKELTGQQIGEGTGNLLICIHGVNYPQQDNRYSESWEWALSSTN